MKILMITGWGQQADSLSELSLSPNDDVKHLDYVKYDSVDSVAKDIPSTHVDADICIGWSLGGQVAARLVSGGAIKPKLLVLLGAPFQYVASKTIKDAVSRGAFSAFKHSFEMLPSDTLRQFMKYVSFGDSFMREMSDKLAIDTGNHDDWSRWLEVLGSFSCSSLSFSDFPQTLIFHGEEDNVVPVSQANYWHESIKNSQVHIFDKCGHAPHLHAPKEIQKIMREVCGAYES